MPEKIELGRRPAKVTTVNKPQDPRDGTRASEDKTEPTAVPVEFDTYVDNDEAAQFFDVSEGEALDFVKSLYAESGNARVLNLKALGIRDIKDVEVHVSVPGEDDALVSIGNLRRVKLSPGDTLRGAKLHFEATFIPEDNDEHACWLLMRLRGRDVMLEIAPGRQQSINLPQQPAAEKKPRKRRGEEAPATH